jgi:DNA-binding NarL/FixJ family response regulator
MAGGTITAILVEDDYGFRQSLKKILSSRYPFMRVVEAEDGKEAIRKINLSPPDLIFMDIRLPGNNGLELTHAIKTRYPGMVVIILSNFDLSEYRETAYRNGADYFISKDAPMGDFLSLVERVIKSGAGPGP